jgi:hypothetical protein
VGVAGRMQWTNGQRPGAGSSAAGGAVQEGVRSSALSRVHCAGQPLTRYPLPHHLPHHSTVPATSDTAPDAPEFGRRDNRWMTTSYYMHYCPLRRRSPRGIATPLSPLPLPLAPPALSATTYTMEYTAEYTRRAHSQSSATDTRPCPSAGL